MKPIINEIEAPCVHCKKKIIHTVHHRIDGLSYPDLKAKVLNSTAFVTQCPHCMGFSDVPQDFRYFDSAGKTSYMIYYFPASAAEELEDIIAGTLCLRDSGTRVHIVHKLTDIAPIINSYDKGEIPDEQLMEVSDNATIRAEVLHDSSSNAMNEMIAAMKAYQETGKIPEGLVEQITSNSEQSASSKVGKVALLSLIGIVVIVILYKFTIGAPSH